MTKCPKCGYVPPRRFQMGEPVTLTCGTARTPAIFIGYDAGFERGMPLVEIRNSENGKAMRVFDHELAPR